LNLKRFSKTSKALGRPAIHQTPLKPYTIRFNNRKELKEVLGHLEKMKEVDGQRNIKGVIKLLEEFKRKLKNKEKIKI
jgi:hypothetical protein